MECRLENILDGLFKAHTGPTLLDIVPDGINIELFDGDELSTAREALPRGKTPGLDDGPGEVLRWTVVSEEKT